MIAELRSMTVRAAQQRRLLAYHLSDCTLYDLCSRLDCSLTTALLLLLSETPRLQCWQGDVERLADERGIDSAALAALLRAAEAIYSPQQRTVEVLAEHRN